MKIILAFLILILSNFKSYAYTAENMYKFCKMSQKIEYASKSEKENISYEDASLAIICDTHISSLLYSGIDNCRVYNEILKISKKTVSSQGLKQSYLALEAVKETTANGEVSLRQAITSFLNFAEKNPDMWKYRTTALKMFYLGKPFPCILQKP